MKYSIHLFFILLTFFACKKETNTTSSNSSSSSNKAYIKFKVDGVSYQYNYGSTALDNDVEQMSFTFNNGNTNDISSINMIYDDTKPLGLETYNFIKNSLTTIVWKKISSDKNNNEYFLFPSGGTAGTASVTVTKMKLMPNSTELYAINGTFTAKLYNLNGGSVEITEGEFFNPLTN